MPPKSCLFALAVAFLAVSLTVADASEFFNETDAQALICTTGKTPDGSTASTSEMEAACAAMREADSSPAKVWVDETCQIMVESYRYSGFVLAKTDGSYMTKCTIEDWPIDRENAIMSCGDGTSPSMVVHRDGRLEFGGHSLYPAGSTNVLCD